MLVIVGNYTTILKANIKMCVQCSGEHGCWVSKKGINNLLNFLVETLTNWFVAKGINVMCFVPTIKIEND